MNIHFIRFLIARAIGKRGALTPCGARTVDIWDIRT
jgi:hypothetical protein